MNGRRRNGRGQFITTEANYIDNFWTKVRKTETCWLWTASTNGKYGRAVFGKNKRYFAHRLVWFLTYGVWPKDLMLHKCDTPLCVNPDHLFEGTTIDNIRDKISKGRQARTRKPIIDGKAWCYKHKAYIPIENFWKNKKRWHGLEAECKDHRIEYYHSEEYKEYAKKRREKSS